MSHHGHPERAAWLEGHYDPWHDRMLGRPHGGMAMSALARLLVPVIISALVQVPWALIATIRAPREHLWLSVIVLALALLGPLALLAARRFPGPVVAILAAAAATDFLIAGPQEGPPYLAFAFAIVGAVVRSARIWAWISVGAAWAVTVTLGLALGYDWHPARVAMTTLGVLVMFGIGEALRSRSENLARFRTSMQQRRQSEVQAERVRIARELHDVLAHSLSQINVQASVGLHLMDKQPERAGEALASIKSTSKTALDEVRSVLGVLRAENGDPDAPLVPEPDLSRLAGLAASVTAQGVEVRLHNTVGAAPQAVQLAVYRIVQESLTNVLRHARATHAAVEVRSEHDQVVASISDDGRGLGDGELTSGRGMLGMRERAELLGGTLETATGPAGGMLVTARIPMKEPR